MYQQSSGRDCLGPGGEGKGKKKVIRGGGGGGGERRDDFGC